MSRTAEILQKALDELGAQAEEPAPSRTELLLAESIKLAKLTKVAQRISKAEFDVLFDEMKEDYKKINKLFAYSSVLSIYRMWNGHDFEDSIAGREIALKAYKQLQLTLCELKVPAGWR